METNGLRIRARHCCLSNGQESRSTQWHVDRWQDLSSLSTINDRTAAMSFENEHDHMLQVLDTTPCYGYSRSMILNDLEDLREDDPMVIDRPRLHFAKQEVRLLTSIFQTCTILSALSRRPCCLDRLGAGTRCHLGLPWLHAYGHRG